MNLFEPPFGSPHSAFSRAVWTSPTPGEEAAPLRRIIHTRGLRLPVLARLHRLGLRRGRGYFKCGSDPFEPDWITSVRVLGGNGETWKVLREASGLEASDDETAVQWLDLGGATARAVLVQLRRAKVDDWWPSWNLSQTGLILEGELEVASVEPAREGQLRLAECDLRRLPRGVEAPLSGGEVRYRAGRLEVGFRLRRAALSYLGLAEWGASTSRSLLIGPSYDVLNHPLREHLAQGVRLAPVTGPQIASLFAYDVEGMTRIQGNRVSYEMRLGSSGIAYRLDWQVLTDRLLLTVERTGQRGVRAWESSALQLAFDCRVAAISVVGKITREGEAGLLELPVLVHAPGYGTLSVSVRGAARWRSDSARPLFVATSELKVGEEPQPEGDYLLPAGRHTAEMELALKTPELAKAGRAAPPAVRDAVRRYALTALSLRADVATLSNNGCSQQAPLCMDMWSALATRLQPPLPGLAATDLLRWSLERWLDGGHGYASGISSRTGRSYDDEYLHTGVACLQGIADYLAATADAAWLHRRAGQVASQVAAMRKRDLDGDGLIESDIRRGVSGSHQWSTNWLDVFSFGWKDAWVNALLHRTLRDLAAVLPKLGRADLAEGLEEWAARLRSAYFPTFFNEKTGWIAGWRCAEGKLHDYAFPCVNGCAVTCGLLEAGLAREIMGRLWAELSRVGFDDFALGLPFNLRKVPDEDMGKWNYGRPLGWYANGGVSLSQARHFIQALYQVGMKGEADRILLAMCGSLADGSAIGGCGSGVDLRTWDGTACGYEGLLCDQLGILAPALDRWGEKR